MKAEIKKTKDWATEKFATKEKHDNFDTKTELRIAMLRDCASCTRGLHPSSKATQFAAFDICREHYRSRKGGDDQGLVKKACPTLGMECSIFVFTKKGTPHSAVTFDSASQAKSFRDVF